jgi:hypothetical protein
MTPKLIYPILFWSVLLYSCKEVSFREPQPAGLPSIQEVPVSLRGQYYSYDQATGEKADTMILEPWGYHFKDKDDKDWLGRGVLSDTLVVKFYENYYFVNFKAGDQWVLRLVRQKPSGALEFLSIGIQDDSKRKEMVKKLSKKFKLSEIKRSDDTFYQINPTPAQLMQLIKEGYFTGTELRKVK